MGKMGRSTAAEATATMAERVVDEPVGGLEEYSEDQRRAPMANAKAVIPE